MGSAWMSDGHPQPISVGYHHGKPRKHLTGQSQPSAFMNNSAKKTKQQVHVAPHAHPPASGSAATSANPGSAAEPPPVAQALSPSPRPRGPKCRRGQAPKPSLFSQKPHLCGTQHPEKAQLPPRLRTAWFPQPVSLHVPPGEPGQADPAAGGRRLANGGLERPSAPSRPSGAGQRLPAGPQNLPEGPL